ncbi:unnamed protein product, partial [marine sediment metagenome]
EQGKAIKQASLLEFLSQASQPISLSEAKKGANCLTSTVKAVVNRGLVELQQIEVKREPISYQGITPSEPLALTDAQKGK